MEGGPPLLHGGADSEGAARSSKEPRRPVFRGPREVRKLDRNSLTEAQPGPRTRGGILGLTVGGVVSATAPQGGRLGAMHASGCFLG